MSWYPARDCVQNSLWHKKKIIIPEHNEKEAVGGGGRENVGSLGSRFIWSAEGMSFTCCMREGGSDDRY